jgi:hypothetical protein
MVPVRQQRRADAGGWWWWWWLQRAVSALRIHVCPCSETLPPALARFVDSTRSAALAAKLQAAAAWAPLRTPAAAERARARAFVFDARAHLTPTQARARAVQRKAIAIERCVRWWAQPLALHPQRARGVVVVVVQAIGGAIVGCCVPALGGADGEGQRRRCAHRGRRRGR